MRNFINSFSVLKFGLYTLLLLTSCSLITDGINIDSSDNIVLGRVLIKEGNCTPGPNSPPCKSIGKKVIVHFTKPSKSYDESYLISKIESDENGGFSGKLSPGRYSIFIEYKNEIHCPFSLCEPTCICSPIEIYDSKNETLNITLDLASY
jgi:hypothetical protein